MIHTRQKCGLVVLQGIVLSSLLWWFEQRQTWGRSEIHATTRARHFYSILFAVRITRHHTGIDGSRTVRNTANLLASTLKYLSFVNNWCRVSLNFFPLLCQERLRQGHATAGPEFKREDCSTKRFVSLICVISWLLVFCLSVTFRNTYSDQYTVGLYLSSGFFYCFRINGSDHYGLSLRCDSMSFLS